MAHNGVLYLDELPEFKKSTLEALRTPIEDRMVTINRVNASVTYPSDFMLIASMNPCPCGFYGSEIECKCLENSRKKYLEKISGPLLDRIDIKVQVNPVRYQDLRQNNKEEKSEIIRKRVERARDIQYNRYKKIGIYTNSQLFGEQIEEFCKIDKKCETLLKKAFVNLKLSARGYSRILKVARTIADMENSEKIEENHLLEAIQYRNLSKQERMLI